MAKAVKNAVKTRGKPFAKGNPGGPGRPKKEVCIPHILRAIGKEPVSDEDKRTKLTAVLENVYLMALGGDLDAIKLIADRTEGKPVQPIDMNVPEEFSDDTPRPDDA